MRRSASVRFLLARLGVMALGWSRRTSRADRISCRISAEIRQPDAALLGYGEPCVGCLAWRLESADETHRQHRPVRND